MLPGDGYLWTWSPGSNYIADALFESIGQDRECSGQLRFYDSDARGVDSETAI